MRVISKDGTTNVPYENNVFCVIIDDENEEYTVAVRNTNLTGFMPLAVYNSKDAAMNAFNLLIDAGEKCILPNKAFQFN